MNNDQHHNPTLAILGLQLNYIVGDFTGNTQKIIAAIEKYGNDYDLLIFSELAISGYPPLDLIEKPGFVTQQLQQLEQICTLTRNHRSSIILGFIADNHSGRGKPFYNALAVIEQGEIRYQYNKQLLPTYNIFDESRHFESGTASGCYTINGVKIGLLICEDAWNQLGTADEPLRYIANPLTQLATHNPDLIISINASPSEINKMHQRVNLIIDRKSTRLNSSH